MDNLEFAPSFKAEGFDISRNTNLADNNLLQNDFLSLDTSTSGSFQDPLLLASNQVAPLTLEEDFTGEISDSEIAPINLSSLNNDGSIDPLIGDLQTQAAISTTLESIAGWLTAFTTNHDYI